MCGKIQSGYFEQQMTGNIFQVDFLKNKIAGFDENVTVGQRQHKKVVSFHKENYIVILCTAHTHM